MILPGDDLRILHLDLTGMDMEPSAGSSLFTGKNGGSE